MESFKASKLSKYSACLCLLGRVASVGEEHRQAAQRRIWTKREEERREEESRAHWVANVQGGDSLGEGEIL
jgi:penicillin V acylase-like amidase (Ntn superfamily)